jgi:hypothetical protein
MAISSCFVIFSNSKNIQKLFFEIISYSSVHIQSELVFRGTDVRSVTLWNHVKVRGHIK